MTRPRAIAVALSLGLTAGVMVLLRGRTRLPERQHRHSCTPPSTFPLTVGVPYLVVRAIALREVGLVLGLEVSRLVRNSLDWYQLLEIAAAFDVLIADEDGVYDPSEFNDRLLLGL